MASGRKGTTRNQSVSRISTESTQPPKNPAVSPMSEPMPICNSVAMRPTNRLMRLPHRNCAATL